MPTDTDATDQRRFALSYVVASTWNVWWGKFENFKRSNSNDDDHVPLLVLIVHRNRHVEHLRVPIHQLSITEIDGRTISTCKYGQTILNEYGQTIRTMICKYGQTNIVVSVSTARR
jgi:hypothetical protein